MSFVQRGFALLGRDLDRAGEFIEMVLEESQLVHSGKEGGCMEILDFYLLIRTILEVYV